MQSTIDDLSKYWNGLNMDANELYTHEWAKHGSCWDDPDFGFFFEEEDGTSDSDSSD